MSIKSIEPIDFTNPDVSRTYHIREKAVKNIIISLLKRYPNAYDHELHKIFNELSPVKLNKYDFVHLKNRYYSESKSPISSLNERMHYHFDIAMTENHLDSLEMIVHQKQEYYQQWKEESESEHPNRDRMEKLTYLIESLVQMEAQLNLGTPLIMFLKSEYDNVKKKSKIKKLQSDVNEKKNTLNINNSNDTASSNTSGSRIIDISQNDGGETRPPDGVSSERQDDDLQSTGETDISGETNEIQRAEEYRRKQALF